MILPRIGHWRPGLQQTYGSQFYFFVLGPCGCSAALADANQAVSEARQLGQAFTLMPAFNNTNLTHLCCGNYASVTQQFEELSALADEKGSAYWKAMATTLRGCVSVLSGKSSDAVQLITSGIIALRSTGATLWMPLYVSHLARAHAELGQFDEAWRCIE